MTLVGVLAADLSLYTGDYRASERTFQLLTQAAGRAGRGREEGIAVVQTYTPDHYGIEAAAAQDYGMFFERELSYRQLMEYPPAAHLLAVYLTHTDKDGLERGADRLKELLLKQADGRKVSIIGPADAYVAKINDIYRKVVYLKSREMEELLFMKEETELFCREDTVIGQLNIQFDMDPMNGF